jgi:hypothetical protein
MSDLHEALAEIDAIRTQVARATQFRGYGPASVAASGLLAFGVGMLPSGPAAAELPHFLITWTSVAAVAVMLVAVEMARRVRRAHSSLAAPMIQAAIEQLLPALVAAVLLTVVVVRLAPQEAWMLPGLWQLFYSLGIFASCRFVPRSMFAAALWYLASGLACLALASESHRLSPALMAIPFGVGQCLVAAVLKLGAHEAT